MDAVEDASWAQSQHLNHWLLKRKEEGDGFSGAGGTPLPWAYGESPSGAGQGRGKL